jgi:hypothetical protein
MEARKLVHRQSEKAVGRASFYRTPSLVIGRLVKDLGHFPSRIEVSSVQGSLEVRWEKWL